MKTMKIFGAIAISVLILLAGCSRVGNNVTQPANQPAITISSGELPVGITDYASDGSPIAGMGALGLFNLHINPSPLSAELTSFRQEALTDVLEIVDLTNFLQIAPCSNCVKIRSVSLDPDGNIVVSIGIKHPFPVGDPMKPITGRNRADLHVFNVEGIVVSNAAGTSFPGIGATVAGFRLLNADGYTGYLDSVLDDIYPTNANIHPYITHFDDYSKGNFDPSNAMGFASVTDPPPSGNLVMAMGCDYNFQDYVFKIDPSTPIDFIYAVGCTYALSAQTKSMRFNPEYRVPQHNKKAASEVRVEIVSDNLKGGDTASTAQIQVKVVDISNGVAVGPGLDQMLSDSSVNDIFIDIPGVMTNIQVLDGNNPTSGIGHDPADPLIYNATITNTAGAVEGTYFGLAKVTDNYAPGQNSTPSLNSMDGIRRVDPGTVPTTGLFAITEFVTYATFTIDVAPGNEPPVAVLITNPDPANIGQFQTVQFDATTSSDPDGTITLYEFDFDWDGVEANFSADISNATGIATSTPYITVGVFKAGLSVTDNLGAIGYDSATISVSQIQVIYVDNSYTGSTHDGTMSAPYITIQDGLTAASSGFQVWVDDSGTNYNGPVTLKSGVTLKSVNWDATDGSDTAVISYESSNPIAVVTGANNATIEGFKIDGLRYGIDCNATSPEIINCQIVNLRYSDCTGVWLRNGSFAHLDGVEVYDLNNNTDYGYATFWGIKIDDCDAVGSSNVLIEHTRIHHVFSSDILGLGGGYCYPHGMLINSSDGVQVKNSIIYDVTGGNYHEVYGIRVAASANVKLVNDIIFDIDKTYYYGTSYGMYFTDCTNLDARNLIISHVHFGEGGTGGYYQTAYGVYQNNSTFLFEYNDVYDCQSLNYNNLVPGTGCISSDPKFVNPGTDFHLQTTSPCVNTGDPLIYDLDTSRSDMGTYGGPDGDW